MNNGRNRLKNANFFFGTDSIFDGFLKEVSKTMRANILFSGGKKGKQFTSNSRETLP